MPTLNKQTLINLLIDSPLRESIKINLIDIINNTNDADLPKVYPTIIKELEIFEKASERRLKLSTETIAKLQGKVEEKPTTPPTVAPPSPSPLSIPPLDLPPFPTKPTEELPTPLATNSSTNADEEALKEIQKELDNLKVSATEEMTPPVPPTTTPEPTTPESPSEL